ncbi:hypothetical protein GCM10010363_07620 [Streptomyces omiyaensis]|uniref:peptidoglycan recognition protein family protein n=1 Tax=Streptomyces omiyaensis TaxID=68247 RepID=UPI0019A104D0|nr:N-acetylmuramoyl-L-alanine amidase [Streptomyces omiyaensis]GGY29650.1 hypothetical protein GCM10010363_07620 [Streptomyces omiyaensis]
MAWYPGAVKMELQPESDQQPAITPDQFIVHSIIAPWTAKRTYEYWRDSTNLESHFGLGYEGDLGQFIGTETRADANYLANRRPNGHGAVSIETASNTSGTDPWTPAQIEELIKLGVWLHQRHGIPLRICPEWDAPGFGYHRLHPEWAKDGTNCPGDARVRQFKEVVFPGIVARATGKTPAPEEDDMAISDDDLKRIALAVAAFKNPDLDPRDVFQIQRDASAYAKQAATQTKGLSTTGLTDAQLDKLADKVADKLAARLAN